MAKEINMMVAKAIYGDSLVFHDDLMATSKEKLESSIACGWLGYDCIKKGELESFCIKLPDYAGSMRNAWLLVERITKEREFYMSRLFCNNNGGWSAHYKTSKYLPDTESKWITAEAQTAQEAICLLFLKFKEGQ